jgi:hypothetical protein
MDLYLPLIYLKRNDRLKNQQSIKQLIYLQFFTFRLRSRH